MIDVKCKGCNKLLAKANSMNAAIKCPRCKMIFEYHIFSNLSVSNTNYLPSKENADSITVEPLEVDQTGQL